MNVLMISPGFPDDMPFFTHGLAEVGATVLGVGDQPLQAVPSPAREALTDYRQVRTLWDEDALVEEVRTWLQGHEIHRVECLWEPGVTVAARLREAFGVPGLPVARALPLRDKETMKATLDAAGIRTPHHYRARTEAEVRAAAERTGYPLIVKPIAGAGSADTWRCDGEDDLERALALVKHVPEVSVEEFIEGEEFTYDTICSNGEILYENVAWYRPKPLVTRLNPWVSQTVVCVSDLQQSDIDPGVQLGRKVIEALGLESGMNHMEWFLTPQGEAVFGEIGGRAPGGRLTHLMNYAGDTDIFRGWAEAVCEGHMSQPTERRFNAAAIFKRAHGEGRIERYEGLSGLLARYGEHVAHIDLVPIGAPRQDWRQVVTGDGWIVVRHPELATTLEMADAFASQLSIHAS